MGDVYFKRKAVGQKAMPYQERNHVNNFIAWRPGHKGRFFVDFVVYNDQFRDAM